MITRRFMGALGLAITIAMAACSGDDERKASAPLPAPAPAAPAPPVPDPKPIATFVPRCSDGDRGQQRHGATCLCCHSDSFGVAGSVDPVGAPIARIVVSDARGDVATMAPNLFANFFRHFTMTPPFRAVAYGPDGRSIEMRADAPSADCNACHYTGGPVPLIHGP